MDKAQILSLLADYGGILVGLALLGIATSVLPTRIRWYVLTAGLGVFGYQAYLVFRSRKRLAEADAERKQLRQETEALAARGEKLAAEVAELNRQREVHAARAGELQKELDALKARGDDIAAAKRKLDEQIRLLDKSNAELLALIKAQQEAEATLRVTELAVAGVHP